MNITRAFLCSAFFGVASGLVWGCSLDDQNCRSCGAGGGTVDGNGGEGDSAGDGNDSGEGDSTGDGDGVGSYDQGSSFCLGHSNHETPSCSAVTFEPDTLFSICSTSDAGHVPKTYKSVVR